MGASMECLVAFSGGKDSFLTVCKLIEDGYTVRLISYDNGAELMPDNVLHGVRRLQRKYGDESIVWEGFYALYGIIPYLSSYWKQTPSSAIGNLYPELTDCQATCLHCQSAMWLAGIAYCSSRGIPFFAVGYKHTDEFCTGLVRWNTLLDEFAMGHGVEVLRPMWDGITDFDRDTEMILRGFAPQVLEPKCTLGCWPSNLLNTNSGKQLSQYFEDRVLPIMNGNFEHYVNIFNNMVLHLSMEDNSEVTFFREMREMSADDD